MKFSIAVVAAFMATALAAPAPAGPLSPRRDCPFGHPDFSGEKDCNKKKFFESPVKTSSGGQPIGHQPDPDECLSDTFGRKCGKLKLPGFSP
ncbi:uncharacterized protein L3040_000821 [Drepanopeziza brunnea f. sp. 'multigermtubi']|uniref:uncharacterized protein n=1 Tax=Drepanopeziza brunnea f. sp. 'multigermtubi' TaxID=698441 RepID=UPI0023A44FE4|nr:hypothetical protein L3040_000821 [Drepanopeziza brunnea f. sp. 'multigermtubi']